MKRLSDAAVNRLPIAVRRPEYGREAHGVGIVHLGLGAFARAHLAEYTDDALQAGGDWRIAGVSMRSGAAREALAPQDCLYLRVARDGAAEDYRLIGAVKTVAALPQEPDRVAGLLAAPTTRIVSLTVTEAGYCQTASTGALDRQHPDIRHDLSATGISPRTVFGLLAAGLAARRAAGLLPFSIMSCDNLAANSERTRALLLAYLRASPGYERLADWVEREGTFPSTMVDRIVPAVTSALLDRTAAALGLRDEAVVASEPFRQWVIEDRFTQGRPEWERGGATLVTDVAPFERAKLRMLNAGHSALAYLGLLTGCATVDQAVATPVGAFVERFMRDEAAPALSPSPLDLDAYAHALLIRFANPALEHRLAQIATDGSQKLPQRVLPTLWANGRAGRPIGGACLIVAAFVQHLSGRDLRGRKIQVADPLASRFAAAADAVGQAPEVLVPAVLNVREAFGPDLVADGALVAAVTAKLRAMREAGPIAAAMDS